MPIECNYDILNYGIHEATHVGGIYDECDSTLIEISAMKISGEDLAFTNGYMTKCGFE